MKQRFYYEYNEAWDRAFVYMGNTAMEAVGSGLLVQVVPTEEAAQKAVHDYTRLFEDMVASEDLTIEEVL